MTDFLLTDEALKRVRYYNADLDVDLLWKKEGEVGEKGLQADVARVRSALVARIADIIKQNHSQPSALDTAVAMAEVLLISYETASHPTRCHKYVIQAISLLASSEDRFPAAVDLFFDLVDRYSAVSRCAGETNVRRSRTLQSYDQTFVKIFLSKLWASGGLFNVDNSLWRIKCIREDFAMRDQRLLSRVRRLGGRRTHSVIFGDSVKILQSMQRRRSTGVFLGGVSPLRSRWSALGDMAGVKRRDSVITMTEASGSRSKEHGITSEASRSRGEEQEIGMAIG